VPVVPVTATSTSAIGMFTDRTIVPVDVAAVTVCVSTRPVRAYVDSIMSASRIFA